MSASSHRLTPPHAQGANGGGRYTSEREPRIRFDCEVVPDRDRVHVVPIGELDIATTPRLEESVRELREAGFDHVILDLRHLTFIDSTGLRPILGLHAAARTGALRLELDPGPPEVQRIFELTGTSDELPFRRSTPSVTENKATTTRSSKSLR